MASKRVQWLASLKKKAGSAAASSAEQAEIPGQQGLSHLPDGKGFKRKVHNWLGKNPKRKLDFNCVTEGLSPNSNRAPPCVSDLEHSIHSKRQQKESEHLSASGSTKAGLSPNLNRAPPCVSDLEHSLHSDTELEVTQLEDHALASSFSECDGVVVLAVVPCTPEQEPLLEAPSTSRSRSSNRSSSPKRKRSQNQSLWQSNVRKVSKNCGQEYVTSRGKVKAAVTMRQPCSCTWDYRHRLSQDDRQSIFNQFWTIGSYERQWEYIRTHSIQKEAIPRVQNQEEPKSCQRRKWAYSYFFKVHDEKIKVCKKMFMATLSICDSWISSARAHLNPEKGQTASPDKRGRHINHPVAITQEKIESVKQHVNLFPRVPSHYCRQSTKREYLAHGLSEVKMAKLYLKWAQEKGLTAPAIATMRQYKDILNANFNISFHKPKKDLCSLCALIRNEHNPRNVREKYKDSWVNHIKRKELLKKLRTKDRNEAASSTTVAVCSYDLQKQLTCPKSEVSSFYYKNKLSVYNFTIFNEINRIGRCYLWHEGIARKGSAEVASSVFMCIEDLVEKGYVDLRFCSDNCAGQKKNRMVFAMYTHAASLHSIKLTHRFLEPGHTSLIESNFQLPPLLHQQVLESNSVN